MNYKFKKNLDEDTYAYDMIFEKMDALLQEKEIPTCVGRDFRTKTGLVTLHPFPYKGNAKVEEKLSEIPGLIRIKKGKMILGTGKAIIAINAHYDGIKFLESVLPEGDTITFY